jgi:ribonuclease HI
MHMLFECPTAVNIWRALDLENFINCEKEIDMSEPRLLEKLLKSPVAKLPGYDYINVQEIIAIAAWYIWWLRRRQSHGEQIPPIQNCVTSIRAMVANAARTKVPMYTQGKKVWLKPGANILKLNVDAAFSEENKNGASGAVLRNSQGAFVAASNNFIPHVASVHMAEALAVLHGLMFANSLGCNVIEAESDSLEVIQLCSGQDRIWNESTAIYADILSTAGMIGKVTFSHCGRESNIVAHELASHSFNSASSCNWVDEPPSFIRQSLLNDVTIL